MRCFHFSERISTATAPPVHPAGVLGVAGVSQQIMLLLRSEVREFFKDAKELPCFKIDLTIAHMFRFAELERGYRFKYLLVTAWNILVDATKHRPLEVTPNLLLGIGFQCEPGHRSFRLRLQLDLRGSTAWKSSARVHGSLVIPGVMGITCVPGVGTL